MASMSSFERSEFKYLLNRDQFKSLMGTIEKHIVPDEYPKYTICNIYMDTNDFRLIRNSIDKPLYKEKMRLRSYGIAKPNDLVFVELKKKFKGVVYKRRVKMPLNMAETFINKREEIEGQVQTEIDYFMNYYDGIGPAMFISYERVAFSGLNDDQLRITFDNNILWRDQDVNLSAGSYGDKILKDSETLMEIKCSNSMPLWLTRALTDNKIYKTSFSKYGRAYIERLKRAS